MQKPQRLHAGDTIGIVSPSWGGGAIFPHRVAQGVAQLERMGFHVKFAPHARNSAGYVSDTPENRAADLHTMFRDPDVTAIIAAIGGDHACHLLPLLDFDLIQRHPKIFMGYSDNTVLNIALMVKADLVTFNGPTLMTELAEFPAMFAYSEEYMRRALCHANPMGEITPAAAWTQEALDWTTQADTTRARTLEKAAGWTWLKAGHAQGRLIGGCLESLQHLRGTPYWPEWQDTIFFWETSEEKPTPEQVDGILMDYANMGVLDRIAGMIVGRPYLYTPVEKEQVRAIILERTQRYTFPIITDMDFGHTSPMVTLPLGCQATLDSGARRFVITEAAVA